MITIIKTLAFLKKINPYVSPILVGVLLFVTTNLIISNRKLESNKILFNDRVTTATKVLEKYKDADGNKHLVIEDLVITTKQKKELIKNSGLIDTVAEALKIARNKINELTKVNATLVAENLKGKADNPSNPYSIIRYVDKYADMTFNPVDTTFGLKYNINLFNTKYTKSDGFLGLNKTNVIDLYSDDKRVTINGVERFSIKVPDPNFGGRIQAKIRYDITTKSYTPAITALLNFKTYGLELNYFYNTKTQKFTPTIGIKKDLFKF